MNPCSSSFRDPDGHIFMDNGLVYRTISTSALPAYQQLMESGLYKNLVDKHRLVSHQETDNIPDGFAKCIFPEQINFFSYPYEWCFSQLKDAALLTLKIQMQALAHNMILKDASAYNVTFHQGAPLFIDTLSFAPYIDGQPWLAYGQFCQHFFAPLVLMAKKDIRLQRLLLTYIDGIPLDLASALLSKLTKISPSIAIHIHAHAHMKKKYEGTRKHIKVSIERRRVEMLCKGLIDFLEHLKLPKIKTEWGDYYSDTNYSSEQRQEKENIVREWIGEYAPESVLDLGANDGTFSNIAAESASYVIAADIDPIAVQNNYKCIRKNKAKNLLPILQDCTQPSPSIGWQLSERESFTQRMRTDMGMALALVHHLVIGNNTPLMKVASFFHELSSTWIVEFPDKEDSQVQRLLANRADIFPNYTRDGLLVAFAGYFRLIKEHKITGSHRTLFFFEARL